MMKFPRFRRAEAYGLSANDSTSHKEMEGMTASDRSRPPKPGPEPDRVKGEDDWKDAVKKALKKKPPEGWPRGDEREDEKDVMDDDT